MQFTDAVRSRPSLRIVLVSIICFWALYYAILTFRALAIYHDHYGMDARALVSLASMGITFLLYLVLRLVPIERLGWCIAAAAILAVPTTILYSTINYYAFLHARVEKEAHWKAPPMVKPAPPAPISGITVPPAPPAPPTPPAMTVGKMEDGENVSFIGEIADQAANGYFFFCSWAALYLALCYAAQLGAAERRAAALQAAAQSAELRALRYQVNPHFLFNTLNSLSSLVLTGKRDAAEAMILNLATFFRTSLTGDPTEDVPLADEIRLQRLYLDIEAVRFPDRLTVEIDLPETLRTACVPGLILQPLVENAVKHGVSRSRRPVTIRIHAWEEQGNLQLVVEDDGDPMNDAPTAGTGVGLRNVRDRLAARYGEQGRSRWRRRPQGGFTVTLEMPLVRDGC